MAERHEAANEDAPEISSSTAGALQETGLSALTLAVARKRPKGGHDRLDEVLEKQAAYLDTQLEHMHEQRELQLSRLRWGRFSDRMRSGMQVMTTLVGLAIAVGIMFALWDAIHADSVVVDTFHSPPALAAKGLDGTVVASGVLDEMDRIQAETRSARAKRGVKDAWSSDIKVEVPETGVSIGEVLRDLHSWLGHETHVTGDLIQTDTGLRLTVRGQGVEAKSFDGSNSDLPKLSTQAAEYIYSEAEPYLAVAFMEAHGRDKEAIEVIQHSYASAKSEDRPLLMNAWGNALGDTGDVAASLGKYQEAIRLQPDFWIGFNNIMNANWGLGREEEVWRTGKAFEKAAHRGSKRHAVPEVYFQNLDTVTWDFPAVVAEATADQESHGGVGSSYAQNGPLLADAAIRMHDPAKADVYLQTSIDAAKDPFVLAMTHFVHGWGALDRGDGARASAEMEAFAAAYADPFIRSEAPGYNCWVAPAEELGGHPDKADAALEAGGHYVDCYRFRGDILDHRGDWAGAQKAYAGAVAIAPDLPAGWYSWGAALARHGDLAGAEVKLAAAHQRGPHWADPLKAWGDALAAQHRYAEAQARYAEAAKYAPRWVALRLAFGNALRAEGKYREAIVQYRAAVQAAGHG
jgi:tetratricopeptide (TPR) repeat protein